MGLPRRLRLRGRSNFLRVLQQGRRWPTAQGTLYVYRRKDEEHHLGLSIRRRIGRAVVRNRLRRRLQEVFRKIEPKLGGGVDMVFVPTPSSRALSVVEWEQIFRQLFRRAGLINQNVLPPEGMQIDEK